MGTLEAGGAEQTSGRTERIVVVLLAVAFLVEVILSFQLFDSMEQIWLVALGFVLVWGAMILGWQARVAFEAGDAMPEGQSWLSQARMVDSGVYGVIRHPMYVAFSVLAVALTCFSQHWLGAVAALFVVGGLCYVMIVEENRNVQTFGDEYVQYMQRVPRLNVLAGLVRAWRRRAEGPGSQTGAVTSRQE